MSSSKQDVNARPATPLSGIGTDCCCDTDCCGTDYDIDCEWDHEMTMQQKVFVEGHEVEPGCDGEAKLVEHAIKADAVKIDAVKAEAIKLEAKQVNAIELNAFKPYAIKPDAIKPDAIKLNPIKVRPIKPDTDFNTEPGTNFGTKVDANSEAKPHAKPDIKPDGTPGTKSEQKSKSKKHFPTPEAAEAAKIANLPNELDNVNAEVWELGMSHEARLHDLQRCKIKVKVLEDVIAALHKENINLKCELSLMHADDKRRMDSERTEYKQRNKEKRKMQYTIQALEAKVAKAERVMLHHGIIFKV